MLFKYFTSRVLLSLATLLGSGLPAAQAGEKSEQTLVLNQIGDIFGHSICYVNRRAIKIVDLDSKAYLVANAPKWDVMFCNDASKKAIKMNLDAWLKHIVQLTYMDSDWDRFDLALTRQYELRKDGRKLVRYKIAGIKLKDRITDCRIAGKAEYLVITDVPAAEQACYIMEKALSTPKVVGVPVEFVNHGSQVKVTGYTRNLGGEDHWLSTMNTREETLPAGFFKYPTGYKLVAKEVEVLNDDKRKKHIDDLVKDMLPSH